MPLARFKPFDRQFEFRIREAGAGLPFSRTLVVLVVHLPRDVDDIGDLVLDFLEFRIVKSLAEAALEFLARELHVALPLPYLRSWRPPA